jgi:signal transduction histidine kinase
MTMQPHELEERDLAATEAGPVIALWTGVSAVVAAAMPAIWAATGRGYFWPMWPWLGLAAPLVMVSAVRGARHATAGAPRGLAVHATVWGVLITLDVLIWAMTGMGYFWPAWAALGALFVLLIHGSIATLVGKLPDQRERELADRVDVLTRTRRGALDVQAAELRRIERDLHDGAQARLVALSMQLGRAEARLGEEHEVSGLLRAARGEASAAIAELRDLARGIAPPVLADRGLAAAIDALGKRSAIDVETDVRVSRRPPPVVETAAYFVVAEALTNVAKHGGGSGARAAVEQRDHLLVIEVADDGPGGADSAGGGLSGLRQRVQALDGTLTVTSPVGEGTTIRAELPCES